MRPRHVLHIMCLQKWRIHCILLSLHFPLKITPNDFAISNKIEKFKQSVLCGESLIITIFWDFCLICVSCRYLLSVWANSFRCRSCCVNAFVYRHDAMGSCVRWPTICWADDRGIPVNFGKRPIFPAPRMGHSFGSVDSLLRVFWNCRNFE